MIKTEKNTGLETLSAPPGELVKIMALQRWSDLIEAFESYYKSNYLGVKTQTNVIKARLTSLFMILEGGFKRWLSKKEYEKLKEQIKSSKIDELNEAYYTINFWLDKKRLNRVDTRAGYDRTNIEEENRSIEARE